MSKEQPEAQSITSLGIRRRIGKFALTNMLILDGSYSDILQVFSNMIVIRAEQKMEFDGIEYTCMGPDFEELPVGVEAPWYTLEFSKDEGLKIVKV